MPIIYCESQVYNQAGKTVFTKLALWADSVYYLPCLCICLCVCVYAPLQNFHFRRSNKFCSKDVAFLLANTDC